MASKIVWNDPEQKILMKSLIEILQERNKVLTRTIELLKKDNNNDKKLQEDIIFNEIKHLEYAYSDGKKALGYKIDKKSWHYDVVKEYKNNPELFKTESAASRDEIDSIKQNILDKDIQINQNQEAFKADSDDVSDDFDFIYNNTDSATNERFFIPNKKEYKYYALLVKYNDKDFVLKKGSYIRKDTAPSCGENYREYRKLITKGLDISDDGICYITKEDLRFTSLSYPASVVAGYNRNGNTFWQSVSRDEIDSIKQNISDKDTHINQNQEIFKTDSDDVSDDFDFICNNTDSLANEERFFIPNKKEYKYYALLVKYNDKDFVLKKGSYIRKDNVPSCRENYRKYRKLITKGLDISDDGKCYITKEDLRFTSLSYPASVVAGGGRSGNTFWQSVSKDKIDLIKQNISDEGVYINQENNINFIKQMPIKQIFYKIYNNKYNAELEQYDDKHFVLKKYSHIKTYIMPSLPKIIKKMREETFLVDVSTEIGRTTEDIFFDNLTAAASFVDGAKRNGKTFWQPKDNYF